MVLYTLVTCEFCIDMGGEVIFATLFSTLIMSRKLLILSLLLLLVGCSQADKITSDVALCEGDLIFRKGSSKESVAVMIADTGGVYTHVGIVVQSGGELMALHTVPNEAAKGDFDRVKLEPIEEFFRGRKAISGAIYRAPLTTKELRQVAEKCIDFYNAKVPFDAEYSLDESEKLYCTELLVVAFEAVGYDITKGHSTTLNTPLFRGRYIFPSDIIANSELQLQYVY